MAAVPCVAGFRVGVDEWENRKYPRLTNRIYSLVDGTVANCEACRQAVVARSRRRPESVAIIPNGVDLTRFNGLPQRAARSENALEQRVGVVANLRPIKNLELFIRAAGRLVPSRPNVRFEIAGEGDLRGELQGLIDELGLRKRVMLLGTVDRYSGIPRQSRRGRALLPLRGLAQRHHGIHGRRIAQRCD